MGHFVAGILIAVREGNTPLDPIWYLVIVMYLAWGLWQVYVSISKINQAIHSFFLAMSRRDLDYVHRHLAKNISFESRLKLKELLSTNAFADYKKARWPFHNGSPDKASMKGYIFMKSGLKTPFRLSAVRENDVWKICSLEELPPDYDMYTL
jgi:hypothetical protein